MIIGGVIDGSRRTGAALYSTTVRPPSPATSTVSHRPVIPTYADELLPPGRLSWRPNAAWALLTAGLLLTAAINLTHVSEFLYYQF